MIIKILNNTTPCGKIMTSHEGSLHSSTLNHSHNNHRCNICTVWLTHLHFRMSYESDNNIKYLYKKVFIQICDS